MIQTEMEQWWERNKILVDGNTIQGGYTKNEIEYVTGKIPLLLDNCVVKDNGQPIKINMSNKFFIEVYKQALAFEQNIKKKIQKRDRRLEQICYTWFIPAMSLISLGTTNI